MVPTRTRDYSHSGSVVRNIGEQILDLLLFSKVNNSELTQVSGL